MNLYIDFMNKVFRGCAVASQAVYGLRVNTGNYYLDMKVAANVATHVLGATITRNMVDTCRQHLIKAGYSDNKRMFFDPHPLSEACAAEKQKEDHRIKLLSSYDFYPLKKLGSGGIPRVSLVCFGVDGIMDLGDAKNWVVVGCNNVLARKGPPLRPLFLSEHTKSVLLNSYFFNAMTGLSVSDCFKYRIDPKDPVRELGTAAVFAASALKQAGCYVRLGS